MARLLKNNLGAGFLGTTMNSSVLSVVLESGDGAEVIVDDHKRFLISALFLTR